MGEVADLYVTLRANTAQFTSGWKKAVADSEGSAAKINAATGKVAKYSVLGLAGIAVAGVKMASDFSDAMNRVNNLAMGGKGNVQQLSNAVLDLAGKVGFSPNNLADALYHIESNFYSVGLGGKQALNALQIAAEGAKIGNADLVDVTNALGAAVASGIPGVQNYSKAMGMLLATVGSGDMTMQNLADAFSTGILAIGKQYGATMQDMGAALATFGDNNIRGQVAATDLRMAIMDLTKQGKPGVAALESIGIAQGQLAHDMQTGGLRKALEDLKQHLDDAGISGTQVGQFLETAFTKKSSAPLAILIDQMDRFNSKFPALESGANKFGSDWSSQTHQFKQVWSEFVSQFESDLIKVGQQLLPDATSALKALGAGFDWIGSNIGTILTLGEYLAGAAAGFYALKLATMAWAAIEVVAGVVSQIGAFMTLATTITSVKDAQALLSLAMEATPWGAIASLVGIGIVGAFKLFHKSSDDATQAAKLNQTQIDDLRYSYDKLNGAIKATSLTQIKALDDKTKVQSHITGSNQLATTGNSLADAAGYLGINARLIPLAQSGNVQALKELNSELERFAHDNRVLMSESMDGKQFVTYAQAAAGLQQALGGVNSTLAQGGQSWRENAAQAAMNTDAFKAVTGSAQLMQAPLINTQAQLQHFADKFHWSADQVREVVKGEMVPITQSGVQQVIDNIGKLPAGIQSVQPQVNAATVNLANSVTAKLRGLSGQWLGIGQNAGAGFAQGITFSIGNAISAAAQLAAAAVNAAQAKLKVKSPSRVFFEIGQWTGEGLALGIDSKTGRVTSAAQSVAVAAVKAAATAPTGTATRVRRESAKKALSMDLPTYLEAAAAAGYTTYGARPPGGAGGFTHHTTVVVQLDRKVLATAVQKEFLLNERRNTSNGLSRRRSAKV